MPQAAGHAVADHRVADGAADDESDPCGAGLRPIPAVGDGDESVDDEGAPTHATTTTEHTSVVVTGGDAARAGEQGGVLGNPVSGEGSP